MWELLDREVAATDSRAYRVGDTDPPGGGPTGHGGMNLRVRIHGEGSRFAVKGHGANSDEVAPVNRHHRPYRPTAG